ncbi:DUF7737 domain-containing protein [Streptomyces sp. MAI_2237]
MTVGEIQRYKDLVGQRAADGEPAELAVDVEGDRMLGVILSKALMLADDLKITDPTILSQL